MDFVRVIRNALILFGLAVLTAWVCPPAHAQENPSKAEANAQCQAYIQTIDSQVQQVYGEPPDAKSCVDDPPLHAFDCRWHSPSWGWKWCNDFGGPRYFYYDPNNEGCPGGEWPDPAHPGQCLSKEKCELRNNDPGIGTTDRVGSAQFTCVAGCDYGFIYGQSSATCVMGNCTWSGKAAYTGYSCDYRAGQLGQPPKTETPEEAAETKPQECVPSGPDSRACVKPDGDICYSTVTGRQVCWSSGETGQKADGPILQERKPGHSEGNSEVQLQNGDLATKQGNTVKTTTTVTNTNNTNNTTVVTSVTNYKTNSGTDAGTNVGEKDDGSGDGKKKGEGKGSASGDCNVQPTCGDGDAIGCAMLRQSWLNHCAFGKDSGKNLEQVAGSTSELDAIPGLATAKQDVQGEIHVPGPDDIDSSGFGARGNCPIVLNFSAMGHSWQIDHPQLCEILDALAALILMVGAFHAAVIVGRGST